MPSLVDKSLQNLCSAYKIIEFIHQGVISNVYLARQIKTNTQVALKCINKQILLDGQQDPKVRQYKMKLLFAEFQTLFKCDSENIIKCHNILENNSWRVLVLEFCKDGNLHQYIMEKGRLTQSETVSILQQILAGYAMLIHNKIIHRNLTAQHILRHQGTYKISGFGLSKHLQSTKSLMQSSFGDKYTGAPEVQKGNYNIQADMWSLGVIYYEMITGGRPFKGSVTEQLIKELWEQTKKNIMSSQSRQFLQNVLRYNPDERLKWAKVFKMCNQRAGIFKVLKQEEEKKPLVNNKLEEEVDKKTQHKIFREAAQRKLVQQVTQISYEKQVLRPRIGFKPKPNSQINDQKNQSKLENNYQIITLIYNSVILQIRQFLEQPTSKDNKDLRYFAIMICSQLIQISEENPEYLYLDQIDRINEIFCHNALVKQFNLFVKQLYQYRAKCLQILEKGAKLKLNQKEDNENKKFEILENFLNHLVVDTILNELENKYMTYGCTEKEHIAHTIQVFNKLCFEDIKDNQKPTAQKIIIKSISEFMKAKYQQLIAKRQKS